MEPTDERESRRRWLGAAACLALLWLTVRVEPAAFAQDPEPTPTEDRLAAPVMPAEPSQADLGATVYYQYCMPCHGDRGQGLTDEFRAIWPEGDQNCWQPKCHGTNHPPGGFELVRYVPPVVGESVVARYQTAAALYAYISERMPWEDPGVLTEEQAWQVTAFLLRANGVETGQEVLGPENAGQVPVASAPRGDAPALPQATPPEMPPPHPATTNWPVLAAAAVVAVALAAAWVLWRRSRPRA